MFVAWNGYVRFNGARKRKGWYPAARSDTREPRCGRELPRRSTVRKTHARACASARGRCRVGTRAGDECGQAEQSAMLTSERPSTARQDEQRYAWTRGSPASRTLAPPPQPWREDHGAAATEPRRRKEAAWSGVLASKARRIACRSASAAAWPAISFEEMRTYFRFLPVPLTVEAPQATPALSSRTGLWRRCQRMARAPCRGNQSYAGEKRTNGSITTLRTP
jgi:hypothetical protein